MENQQLSTIKQEIIRNNRGTTNTVFFREGYVEIHVTNKKGTNTGTVLVDKEDYAKLGLIRVSQGYAAIAVKGGACVHHIVMEHTSNTKTVVDHINSDKLDNRKHNLRIVSFSDNSNNRNINPENNTGVVGIIKRKHPKYNYTYFRATVSDRTTLMATGRSKTKQVSKHFNISKLGEAKALALAKEWLEMKREEFNYLPKIIES